MSLVTSDMAALAGSPSGSGLPTERMTRIAARRAFVEMKQSYLGAAADIPGPTGAILQRKLRSASEPWELWPLRAVILASLPTDHPGSAAHRKNLQRELDAVFDRDAA
jgi:hypothetical protein